MESLKILLEQVEETYSENDVTSLCLCMLELAGKTFTNGYKITTQAVSLDLIPDISIRILFNNNPLIVIECKGGNGHASNHYNKSLKQIKNYIEILQYPYGFLVFPNRSIFLTKGNREANIKAEWENNTLDNTKDIIDTIKDL
ncbi:hypothetical protein CONCODRAFT_10020 [Conidiobolus coronatus NRRL 28638]|uniref:Type I restriction enzyme R protein N-terminal domain-containing protein n=1 Tax=Conidiobolus coronatus (strain ATCC 28846 / CBS 209.66 / NRRL 28638) TaxID=796925 RepID=A0A137NYT6_CONC2|nr:hypothetical protein CONCODRAFT_10020 [Conidiobolus coronatus NRRL 28638]|eukprot:KXN67838.1 hypothetical protein CONCODRAFT_10020 [Conidiobolus coronatus NRRL 28638]